MIVENDGFIVMGRYITIIFKTSAGLQTTLH